LGDGRLDPSKTKGTKNESSTYVKLFTNFAQKLNQMKTKLSVNINKVALIRNSRGGNMPDIIQFAKDCENYGADGITVHPRPDQRHIRYDDIPLLKSVVTTELNIEGYPSDDFHELVMINKPHQVTLVPDPPGVLTSSEGWNIVAAAELLSKVIADYRSANIRVSLFVEPDIDQIAAAKNIGADRVELYTGHYAHDYKYDRDKAIARYTLASQAAMDIGIGLNAGHDLNLDNLKYFKDHTQALAEVSIGHALITDALYYGIKNTLQMYKRLLT
jgi:pyridoxine 5-phosphate synthase